MELADEPGGGHVSPARERRAGPRGAAGPVRRRRRSGGTEGEGGWERGGADARGLKVGKQGAGGRAGALAQAPRAREPGEVELGGGAGRAEGGGEGGGAGSVFGAPRRGAWRPPVRAGRCVCALPRSGRTMAQKGKLG